MRLHLHYYSYSTLVTAYMACVYLSTNVKVPRNLCFRFNYTGTYQQMCTTKTPVILDAYARKKTKIKNKKLKIHRIYTAFRLPPHDLNFIFNSVSTYRQMLTTPVILLMHMPNHAV